MIDPGTNCPGKRIRPLGAVYTKTGAACEARTGIEWIRRHKLLQIEYLSSFEPAASFIFASHQEAFTAPVFEDYRVNDSVELLEL